MTSLQLGGRIGSLSLVACLGMALAPPPARAEPLPCDITDDGTRTCPPPMSCTTRRTCVEGPGTEDWFCQGGGVGSTARFCMPSCTTMFGCATIGVATDCPVITGVTAGCQPTGAAPSTPNVCTYRQAGSTTIPLSRQVTYCARPSETITPTNMARCHTRPPSAGGGYTPNYFEGDCDMDGCANGSDTDPCASLPGACTSMTEPTSSPFCPPRPPLACAVDAVSGALSCADARPCVVGGADCPAGQACETGWSDGPRCRPSCSTLFLCDRPPAGMPAPAEQCPDYPASGLHGSCVPYSGPHPGYDGVCVYGSFLSVLPDTSCSSTALPDPVACFRAPDGSMTTNFFDGDCDGDRIVNGCDPLRCSAAAGGPPICISGVPGAGCAPTLPPPDAGAIPVDAGTALGDANVMTFDTGVGTDAALPPLDAGSPLVDAAGVDVDGGDTDAGNVPDDASVIPTGDSGSADAAARADATAFDVGTEQVDASGGSFTGGGGCRCSAAGSEHGGLAGLGLATLALTTALARRRTRR